MRQGIAAATLGVAFGVSADFVTLDGLLCISPSNQTCWFAGENRVCRGATENDNKAEYYSAFEGVGSLQLCKAQCAQTVAWRQRQRCFGFMVNA